MRLPKLCRDEFARDCGFPQGPLKPQFPGSRSAISGRRYYNPALGRFLERDPKAEKCRLWTYPRVTGASKWEPITRNDRQRENCHGLRQPLRAQRLPKSGARG